jgi:penicillin G amidase
MGPSGWRWTPAATAVIFPRMLRLPTSIALALIATAALPRPIDRPGSAPDQSLDVPCLAAPARVVTDRWGIPHVRAASLDDLYFAWGFITARDRLWQLEVTRRGARGELWEWFGNRSLTSDGGVQLFELRERAERMWARERANPDVRMPLERYAAGINAWIDRCRRGEEPWPIEFQKLGRRPGEWRPENAYLVLLAQAMLLDLDLPELDEAREIREHGRAWVEARHRFERDQTFTSIPPAVADRIWGRPHHPTLPGQPFPSGTRTGARVPNGGVPEPLLAEARRAIEGWLSPATRDPDMRASNVFAVGPRRTAHGAPILANDPHLSLGAPGPLYAIHLEVPGVLDVAGATVPGMPVVVSGRNADCAWGITALGADVMDVYADTLDASGTRVRWRGGWAPVREADFAMRYRFAGIPLPTFGRKRRYTPHGPVLAYDKPARLALSLRWAEDDARVSFAKLLRLSQATRADTIAADVRTIVQPTSNLVMADREGHVIYQTVGAVPRRGFDPGYGPLPDDGRREWQGLIAPEDMPRWELGPDDVVVNGNNLPVGPPYPEPLVRYEFMQDRAARMAQRLAGDHSLTLDDAISVQNDVESRAAERYVPLLLRCADSVAATLSPRARAALDTLRGWDYRARTDRVAPTLFRGWLGAVSRRDHFDGLPGLALAAFDGRAPEELRGPNATRPERPAVAAAASLELALTEMTKLLGPDLSTWRYGRAHQARFRHALAWRDSTLGPPPVAEDGDNSTVSVGRSSLPWNPWVTHGPVWRHVVDLAVPESSLCVIPPGNAGSGRHARDLLSRWANHGYVPLYRDWSRIEAAKESDWTLDPGGPGGRR